VKEKPRKNPLRPHAAALKRRGMVGLSVIAALLCTGRGAMAQNISCFQSLDFGSLLPATGAGTASVAPDGTLTTTGGVVGSGGTPFQGRCLVTGQLFPVRPMVISITAPSYNIIDGANNMNVDNFHLVSTGIGRTVTITAFITTVDIGARLNLGANQAAGSYTGTFTMSVNYQ
jgi:hypothetical protein